ncbi:MAG: ribosome silencing factor [Ruminococcaceae bacterium]|nr:ribosome silencing factor [Oscillospiraceae bacterium]
MNSFELMKKAVNAADDRKAIDISVLHVEPLTTLCDYFVICSGTSAPHVNAIYEEIDEKLSEIGVYPASRQGVGNPGWVLLDYGDVIVHIFNESSREFYSIERLWSDAEQINVENLTD